MQVSNGQLYVNGTVHQIQNVYIFNCRVRPDRFGVNMTGITDRMVSNSDGTFSYFKFDLTYGQLTVQVFTSSSCSILDLKNVVTSLARVMLDALGYVSAAALDLEVISCVEPGGQVHVFDTAFDGLREEEGPERDKHEHEMLNRLINQAYEPGRRVATALADLRKAILNPSDTCSYCYRAVESIRQAYVPNLPDEDKARKLSWQRLRQVTGATRAELDWLADHARPGRHGAPIDVSHEDRMRALRIARQVVAQHCLAQDATAISVPAQPGPALTPVAE